MRIRQTVHRPRCEVNELGPNHVAGCPVLIRSLLPHPCFHFRLNLPHRLIHGQFEGVQNPLISLEGDVAATKRAIANLSGPVILVGHSYGGAVITEAGSDRKVVGLVYVAAFAPDKGESVSSMIADLQPGAPQPPILPPQDGYLFLDRAKFPSSFAADVKPETAVFMADSQVPWGAEALNGTITEPAWKTKPSWYVISTEDKMIPPDAQRLMSKRAGSTAVEVKGSHAVFVSQPQAVAALIETAARESAK